MRKIAIIGNAGSGKSTLALILNQKLGLPLYPLDKYCWNPGWQKVEFEHFKKMHDELCQQESWIIEGSYYKLLHHRATHADTIVYLDIPTHICLWRVIKRALLNFGQEIDGNPTGCRQNLFTRRFLEFLKWIWSFNVKHKPDIMNVLNDAGSCKVIYILKSNKDITQFLSNINHDNQL